MKGIRTVAKPLGGPAGRRGFSSWQQNPRCTAGLPWNTFGCNYCSAFQRWNLSCTIGLCGEPRYTLKVYARSTNIVERLVNTLWSLYVVEGTLVGVAGAAKPRVHRSISYWACCSLLPAACWLPSGSRANNHRLVSLLLSQNWAAGALWD